MIAYWRRLSIVAMRVRCSVLVVLIFMVLCASSLWASDAIQPFSGTGKSGHFSYSIYNNRWLRPLRRNTSTPPRVTPRVLAKDKGEPQLTRDGGYADATAPVSPVSGGDLTVKSDGGGVIAITAVSPEAQGDLVIPSVIDGYTVYSITEEALANCVNVTSITIPTTFSKLEPEAFNRSPSLTTIHVEEGHPRFASVNGALYDSRMRSLLAVGGGWDGEYTVPDSTVSIGPLAFARCTGIKSLILPEGLVDIGGRRGRSFLGCTGLERITLPHTITNIGQFSFKGCVSLKQVTIPPKVTKIPFGLFWQCSGLTHVALPEGITSIGNYAFAECTQMKMAGFPKSLTTIDAYAFKNCRSFQGVTVPAHITKIHKGAFMGSGITLPEPDSE